MSIRSVQRHAENQAYELLAEYYDSRTIEPRIDLDGIAGWLGIQVIEDDFDDDTSGVLILTNEESVIGLNGDHPENRQRFTIAHEIGHFILHKNEASVFVDRSQTFHRDSRTSEGVDLHEIAANTFAAVLLMPKVNVDQYVDKDLNIYDENSVREVADRFGVSPQAMSIRLSKLGWG